MLTIPLHLASFLSWSQLWTLGGVLASALATRFAQNMARGYSAVSLTKAADADSWWKCQTGSLSPMSTGYSAFCKASAVGSSRPFLVQLTVHAWKELPWCGPFTCDVESGAADIIASLAAACVMVVALMLLLRELAACRTRKKRRPLAGKKL
jgi:hypothetical protein